ncbi:MAG: FAD:protein FMN transferase [Patescibacteria group bacterium]|nr:FAD:protein FMN transferase [Patescibacteria group bacterium]
MHETRLIMGMPIEIEIVGAGNADVLEAAFAFLVAVDERFSTYKEESEISRLSRAGALERVLNGEVQASADMREVLALAERTKAETGGYFDIRCPDGTIDPSGIVKGWAVKNAAARMRAAGHEDFFVNAGGDIAMGGVNAAGGPWSVGIRNPFKTNEVVKIVYPKGRGVATSGSYIRGAHIYNPHAPEEELRDIVSTTVIGPDVLEADRFATAAFAMGRRGIEFIETLQGFEGYAIDAEGVATMTSGLGVFTMP